METGLKVFFISKDDLIAAKKACFRADHKTRQM